jgi:3-methyladenine DNA glycosylase AlkD
VPPVMTAAYCENWDLVEEIITKYKVNLNFVNKFDNWTILHIVAAAFDNNKEVMKLILESAKSLIDYQ